MFNRLNSEKENNWKQEVERIKELKKRLDSLGDFPSYYKDTYPYAVDFFNIVSLFQDEGYISNAPKKLKDVQKEFNKCIKNSGRDKYGINRTSPGEKVTLDNTYWGNIYGIWTQTSRHFMNDCDNSNPPAALVVGSFQIRPFITNNRQILLELCNKFCAA